VVREREKKGGAVAIGRRSFTRGVRQSGSWDGGFGVEWRHAAGGREGGVLVARGERGGGPAAVARERQSRVTAGRRCSVEQGSGVADMWGLGHSTGRHGKI
jgi:hypothetical protein